MNYRRNSGKLRALTALCAALAVLCAGLGTWAVVGQVRVSKLTARVAELEAAGAQAQGAIEAQADYDADAIAAEFEGGVVTVGEAMAEYQTLASYYEMLGVQPEDYAEDAKTTVLSGLVETKILALKAQELGLDAMTDEERAEIEAQAAADFEELVDYYMAFRAEEGKSEEEAREETISYLAESGDTLESAIEDALLNATQQRLYDYVTAEMSVDDAQLRSFYDEQLESAELIYSADFSQYETILIPFDADQSVEYLSLSAAVEEGDAAKSTELDALYAALEPEAQRALDRLNGGEDFAALAAEYGSLGPDGGSFVGSQSTLYGDEFRDAALALTNIGDTSGVVRTEGGLCILRYASDVTPGAVPYEQVAGTLRGDYEEELKLKQYNDTVVRWIADANVKYYTDRF